MIIEKSPEHLFDIESVTDAMAVWEAVSLVHLPGHKLPGDGMISDREYVASTFTPFCLKWFDYLQKFFFWSEPFDMEFVPKFVATLPTFDVANITRGDLSLALSNVLNGIDVLEC